MKITVTWERLFDFMEIAGAWLAKDKANENTKLGYAIQQRMQPRLKKAVNKYNSRRQDIAIEYAVTDDKKHILKDERGEYIDTVESATAKKARWEKLYEEGTYEIEPYFATELPEDLTDIEVEALTGFVIRAGAIQETAQEEAVAAAVN